MKRCLLAVLLLISLLPETFAQTSVTIDANGFVRNTLRLDGTSKKLIINNVEITGITPDASTTVKGLVKLSTAPASPTNPIAAGDNDSRMTNARTPTAHASTHASGGTDPVTLIISQITGLQSALDLKAPLNSPSLTGVPIAPTAAVDTNTTQIATTGFVLAQAANTTPIVASTGAVGASTRYARGDHVHPAQTSVTGNAGTATALQTARTINGVSFDGTANITVTAAASTLTGTTLASNVTASSLLSASGGTFGTNAFNSTAYQPEDPDLTALAALTTAAFGRDLLTKIDAAGIRTYIGVDPASGTKNVMDYGAQANDIADDTAAINAALTAAGQYGRIFIPKGTYYIAGQLNKPIGCDIIGAGMDSTFLHVKATSNPANATIFCSLPGQRFGLLQDFTIKFDQPNTVGMGWADLIQYKPAIIGCPSLRLTNIAIWAAWDGIDFSYYSGSQAHLDNVRIGAFNNGIKIADTRDNMYVSKLWMQGWGMGSENSKIFYGNATPNPTACGINILGQCDGLYIDQGLFSQSGPAIKTVTPYHPFVQCTGVWFDGQSRVEQGAGVISLIGCNLNGGGLNKVTLSGGVMNISGGSAMFYTAGISGSPMIDVSGGSLNLTGNQFVYDSNGESDDLAIRQTGGITVISGNVFTRGETGSHTFTNPTIVKTGGVATIVNNRASELLGGTSTFLSISGVTTDDKISGNVAPGWVTVDGNIDLWAGITPGTGVGTALAVNVGSAGAFVAFNGALGTPSSGTLTNANGLPPAGVTGTAAILGANTFTGTQTITGSGLRLRILPTGVSGSVSEGLRLDNTDNTYASGSGTGMTFYYSNGNKAFGSINTLSYVGSGQSSDMAFSVRTSEALSEKIRIRSDGNVGIGTTAPLSKLSINGGLHVGGDSNAGDNNAIIDGTLSVIGTSTLTGGIVGKTDASNATAGNVGEYISASVVVGSATALTTATPKTVTSISLTAGDWDITAIGALTGASTGTVFDVAVGTTTNSFTGTVSGDSRCQTPTVSLTGADASLMIPAVRVSISATTTYYLIVQETFTIGSPAAYGRISARRVR